MHNTSNNPADTTSKSGEKVSHFCIGMHASPIKRGMRYKGIKGKAWESVKRSVRRRETDCYTCFKTDLLANGYKADSGHYKPVALVGSNNKLSWHPAFIHLQCATCNGSGQGMAREYEAHLRQDFGDELVDWFESNWRKTNPVKNWQEVIDLFDSL